jgi:hypothetical protein
MVSEFPCGTLLDAFQKVAESNRIENMSRPPTEVDIQEHERFVNLEELTVEELQLFVSVCQSNAVLRDTSGLNVWVGGYLPPQRGPQFQRFLGSAGDDVYDHPHLQYEIIHPSSDCIGRSGSALSYWVTRRDWKYHQPGYRLPAPLACRSHSLVRTQL